MNRREFMMMGAAFLAFPHKTNEITLIAKESKIFESRIFVANLNDPEVTLEDETFHDILIKTKDLNMLLNGRLKTVGTVLPRFKIEFGEQTISRFAGLAILNKPQGISVLKIKPIYDDIGDIKFFMVTDMIPEVKNEVV